MLYRPTRSSARQHARAASMQAPVGGWDARSPRADMPADRAIILDNWFPDRDKVVLRNGSSEHATIAGGADVETLMEYVPTTGTAKLFAAAGTVIYDVTAAGAGTSVATGFTSAEWVYTQLGNSAGNFLFAANGADTLQRYDGSTWANSTITGPTLASVAWLAVHQNRLWLGEKQSLTAYYLATNAVAGSATSFNLSSYVSRGGFLIGMGTWTRDGGDGVDDWAVFLTSEGEAIVFSGTDPSSASTWALVGVFRMPRPLNRRSMIKAGSDLIIATEGGVLPVSRMLITDRSQAELVALSDNIDQAFADAVRDAAGATSGWQVFMYPRANMLLVNVPRANADPVQFVFNTLTGAACRFTGLPANCWGLLGDTPYYGGEGQVVKFDDGDNDQGQPIVGNAVQAFSYFGSASTEKRFSRVEVVLEASAEPNPTIDVMTDFAIVDGSALKAPGASESSLWDVFVWDIDLWGAAERTRRRYWVGVEGHGRSAAVRVQVNSLYARPAWIATNWLLTPGGPL